MVGAFVSPRIPLVRNLASFVQRSRMHQSATSEQLACRPPMRMSGLAAKSIGSKIVLTAAIILTSLFPAPGLSARDYTSSPEPVPQIHNQMLHYGNYCGPGPRGVCTEEGCKPVPGLPPVDDIDQSCLLHDMSYGKCKMDLQHRGITPFPGMHLVMAVRGALPPPLAEVLIGIDDQYATCMNEADTKLVNDFQGRIDSGSLPRWWDEPALAPKGAENTEGFKVACAVPLPGTKACLAESKFVFTSFTNLFHRDLQVDQELKAKSRGRQNNFASSFLRPVLRNTVITSIKP